MTDRPVSAASLRGIIPPLLAFGVAGLYACTHGQQLFISLAGIEALLAGAVAVAVFAFAHKLPNPYGDAVRGLVVFACLIFSGVIIFGLNPDLFASRVSAAAFAAVIIIAGLSIGQRVISLFKIKFHPIESLLVSSALGFGMFSITIMLVGVAGLVSRESAIAVLLIFILSGIKLLPPITRQACVALRKNLCELSPAGGAAWALILVCVVLLLPGVFFPPLDYDVLEYHIQFPREYMDLGRVAFLPHSAFSGFPQGSEMLTLFSFMLTGGYHGSPLSASTGIWLAKMLNFWHLPLLLGAAVFCVKRWSGCENRAGITGGLIAAVLAVSCVQTMALGMKLYVELEMSAYTLLALLVAERARDADKEEYFRLAVLAGILAGIAASTKYPALLFAGLPICLIVFFAGTRPLAIRVKGALLAGVFCWLIISPWLIKNIVSTGNPLYPIGNSIFNVKAWDAEQEQRFIRAHRPTREGQTSLSEMARQAWRVGVGGDAEVLGGNVSGIALGALGLVFIPLLLLRKNCRWLPLAAWYGAGFLVWFYFTHHFERFFYPLHLLAILLSGCGFAALAESPKRHAVTALGAVALSLSLATVVSFCVVNYRQPLENNNFTGPQILDVLVGKEPTEKLLARSYMPWSLREAMKKLPEGSRVMLYGAADPFWLPGNLEYAMVFSKHPLHELLRNCGSADEVRAKLLAQGITHIHINWPELARLHATQFKAYALNPEAQNRLRQLLSDKCFNLTYRLRISPPWNLPAAAEKRDWIRTLLADWPEMFGANSPRGEYARSPYELYELKK